MNPIILNIMQPFPDDSDILVTLFGTKWLPLGTTEVGFLLNSSRLWTFLLGDEGDFGDLVICSSLQLISAVPP